VIARPALGNLIGPGLLVIAAALADLFSRRGRR
jgi:hypothetical protein